MAGQSVTLVLSDEIDVSRGDVLCGADDPAAVADQFEAQIIWMHDDQMLPGRPYLMKLGTQTVGLTIAQPNYKVNVNTLEHIAGHTLELNEIGVATIATDRSIAFDPYAANRAMGGFVIIDRTTNATVGAGLIKFSLRRSQNVPWQALEVTAEARSTIKGHQPGIIWFTGVSGAGKSTIANRTEAAPPLARDPHRASRRGQRPPRAQP